MKRLNPLKVGLPALAMTSALAFASASHAAITPFSEDFQGTFPVGFTDWTVFSDNAGMGSYTVIPPSASGPQISALADDGAGNQYLNFFANYGNTAVHNNPFLQEAISFFHEFDFTAADTAGGTEWVFDFEYASNPAAPITGDTEVGAFIRVFDPVFNLLEEQTLDTGPVATPGVFQSGQLSVTLDPAWTEGRVQIGFNNLVGEFEGSGRFYDNVNFAPVPLPAAAWLFLPAVLGLFGMARRRRAR